MTITKTSNQIKTANFYIPQKNNKKDKGNCLWNCVSYFFEIISSFFKTILCCNASETKKLHHTRSISINTKNANNLRFDEKGMESVNKREKKPFPHLVLCHTGDKNKLPTRLETRQQIGLYIENRKRFTEAVKEFTHLNCQMKLPGLMKNTKDVCQKFFTTPMGNYDSITLYLEKGVGKLGLMDLEHVATNNRNKTESRYLDVYKKMSQAFPHYFNEIIAVVEKYYPDFGKQPGTDCYYLAVCKTMIQLFPYHYNEIMAVVEKYYPDIKKHGALDTEKEKILSGFKLLYQNHREFVREKNINSKDPASFSMTDDRKSDLSNAVTKKICKPFKGMNTPDTKTQHSLDAIGENTYQKRSSLKHSQYGAKREYSETTGDFADPKATLEEVMPEVINLVVQFLEDGANEKRSTSAKIANISDLTNLRVLKFSCAIKNIDSFSYWNLFSKIRENLSNISDADLTKAKFDTKDMFIDHLIACVFETMVQEKDIAEYKKVSADTHWIFY